MDEIKEEKPSFLEEVRKEKAEMQKLKDEITRERVIIEQLKAEDILSGKTTAQINPEKKELTPKEYKEAVLKGAITFN